MLLEFWRLAAEGTNRHDPPGKIAALLDRDPEALVVALGQAAAGPNRRSRW